MKILHYKSEWVLMAQMLNITSEIVRTIFKILHYESELVLMAQMLNITSEIVRVTHRILWGHSKVRSVSETKIKIT